MILSHFSFSQSRVPLSQGLIDRVFQLDVRFFRPSPFYSPKCCRTKCLFLRYVLSLNRTSLFHFFCLTVVFPCRVFSISQKNWHFPLPFVSDHRQTTNHVVFLVIFRMAAFCSLVSYPKVGRTSFPCPSFRMVPLPLQVDPSLRERVLSNFRRQRPPCARSTLLCFLDHSSCLAFFLTGAHSSVPPTPDTHWRHLEFFFAAPPVFCLLFFLNLPGMGLDCLFCFLR